MSCQTCGKAVEHPVTCPGCSQLFYCSRKHQIMHRNALGHEEECARMAAQASRRQELASHPFPWSPATHRHQPCTWLQQLGLHRRGAWLLECPCGATHGEQWGAAAPLLRSIGPLLADSAAGIASAAVCRQLLVQQLGDFLGLPPEQAPCLASQAPSSCAPLTDWASYYQLRGLPLESPAALLLDATLTTHAAVLRMMQQRQQGVQPRRQGMQQEDLQQEQEHDVQPQPQQDVPPQQQQRQESGHGWELPQPLVIHLLGPQKELDQWPLLLELGCLLPQHTTIQLHLVGPELPPWAHGGSVKVAAPPAGTCGRANCSCTRQQPALSPAAEVPPQGGNGARLPALQPAPGSQELLFWRGQYHELAAELAQRYGQPHVVVAPNAGLAAYPSWVPTLQHLADSMQRLPCSGGGGGGGTGVVGSFGTASSSSSTENCRSGEQQDGRQGPTVCCFSDYAAEAVHRARLLCEHLLAGGGDAAAGRQQAPGGGGKGRGGGKGVILESGLNPFRKPAAVLAADNRLPSASNGFVLWWL